MLAFFGTEYEAFQRAAGQMMERFRGCIPEGSDLARIRCTRRETRDPSTVGAGVLADTLGEETAAGERPYNFGRYGVECACVSWRQRIVAIFPTHRTAGLVVIDPSAGHPLKYDDVAILESAVASSHVRLELDVSHGQGWRRTGSFVDTQGLGDAWREDISAGARHILQMSYVPAHDEHYDR